MTFKCDSERNSEAKRAAMVKSYSQKSLESLRTMIVGGSALKKQDSTTQLLRELHNQEKKKQLEEQIAYSSNRNF